MSTISHCGKSTAPAVTFARLPTLPPAASTAQTATLARQAPRPAPSEWEAKLTFGSPLSPSSWSKSEVAATPAKALEATSTAASPAPRNQPTFSGAEIGGFLARGDWLFATGDIASARLLYERAADAGEARAAVRLGRVSIPFIWVTPTCAVCRGIGI